MENGKAAVFLDKLTDMVDFLIPNYILEGKNQLVISIGCTGGRHRSVTLANALYQALEEKGELRRPPGTPGYRQRSGDKAE